MSKSKFDFRRMDFDDCDEYEDEQKIKRDVKRINNLPEKHLKKVVKIEG